MFEELQLKDNFQVFMIETLKNYLLRLFSYKMFLKLQKAFRFYDRNLNSNQEKLKIYEIKTPTNLDLRVWNRIPDQINSI